MVPRDGAAVLIARTRRKRSRAHEVCHIAERVHRAAETRHESLVLVAQRQESIDDPPPHLGERGAAAG